jgi:hypothetical protein
LLECVPEPVRLAATRNHRPFLRYDLKLWMAVLLESATYPPA